MQKQLVRTSLILTSSYVTGDGVSAPNIVKNPSGGNQLMLVVDFTKGSTTSGEVKVEPSYDDVKYGREINGSVSSGTTTISANEYTFTASGIYIIPVPTMQASSFKISAKETGADATGSLMAIDAYIVKV